MSTQICVFNPTTSLIDIIIGASSFTGSVSDAGKPLVLDANGGLDSSFIGNPITAVASVNFAAGQLINVYNNGGVITARLANAANASSLPAHGFVTVSANSGATINVFTQGLVNISYTTGFTTADVGSPVYLSNTTAGFITKTAPSGPDLIQPLGYIYLVGLSPNAVVQVFFLPNPLASEYMASFATTSGICAVGQGGTGVSLSATGGAHQVLKQTTVGGNLTVAQLAFTDISGTLGVAAGGTGASLSSTGGTGQYLKQITSGGVVSVAAIAAADLPLATTGAFGAVKPDGSTITISGGVITANGASPGGSTSQIQYNSSGSLAGAAGLTTNGSHFAFGGKAPDVDGPAIVTITPSSSDTSIGGVVLLDASTTWNPSGTFTDNFNSNSFVTNMNLDSATPTQSINFNGMAITVTDSSNTIGVASGTALYASYNSGIGGTAGVVALYGVVNVGASESSTVNGVIGQFNTTGTTLRSGDPSSPAYATSAVFDGTATGGSYDILAGVSSGSISVLSSATATNITSMWLVGNIADGTSTVTNNSALFIDISFGEWTGAVNNYAILSQSINPSVFSGSVAVPYILPQTIHSAAGTPLPGADVSLRGAVAIVSDATSPTYMAPYTSGGSITCQVICSVNLFASPPVYAWLTK